MSMIISAEPKDNTKFCPNCHWLVNNVCENSNWKTGKIIEDFTKEPVCGFIFPMSKFPTSFKKIEQVSHAKH